MRLHAALALILAGCASTPQEVIQEGPRSDHDLKLAPAAAAGCISRNAENLVDSIQAPMRPLPEADYFEVVIRNMGSDFRPILMVGIVAPRTPGARVTFHGKGYISPPRAEFVSMLVKGC